MNERLSELYDRIIKEDAIAELYNEYFLELDNESRQILENALKQVVLNKISKPKTNMKKQYRLFANFKQIFSKLYRQKL